ncbi:unnamed protein product [Gongylonema pulchrum]|uniref:Uncharacterized protein n=1 Tax=Gongylonema pulchrum TaxID=637853 RepID=A0A183EYH4_9BILA|nr:unnamed protein product [Gongylonema pulchrum]
MAEQTGSAVLRSPSTDLALQSAAQFIDGSIEGVIARTSHSVVYRAQSRLFVCLILNCCECFILGYCEC